MNPGKFVDLMDGGPPIDIVADVRFLSTAEGGKKHPIRAPYRPNHNFGTPENLLFYIGQIEIIQGSEIVPGESGQFSIHFLSSSRLRELLNTGREWRIQEGTRLIARARVLKVLGSGP